MAHSLSSTLTNIQAHSSKLYTQIGKHYFCVRKIFLGFFVKLFQCFFEVLPDHIWKCHHAGHYKGRMPHQRDTPNLVDSVKNCKQSQWISISGSSAITHSQLCSITSLSGIFFSNTASLVLHAPMNVDKPYGNVVPLPLIQEKSRLFCHVLAQKFFLPSLHVISSVSAAAACDTITVVVITAATATPVRTAVTVQFSLLPM